MHSLCSTPLQACPRTLLHVHARYLNKGLESYAQAAIQLTFYQQASGIDFALELWHAACILNTPWDVGTREVGTRAAFIA